ncbi:MULTISPECIES: hypothetical protein [Bacillus]|uniref:hypothetical protein n=1 Tax=Bacillus TaxID=1386 RepID=UPI0011869409|nr:MULTISPECIES: hypothetical protein [Bacillus]TSI21517.1 hypothetical protein FOT98_02805 [Bacillus sp. HY001]
MAKYYGYVYDENGKFTEMIPVNDKPIYEKKTFYREEVKETITQEKLCELHQSIKDGTYEPPQPEEGEEVVPHEPIPKEDCHDCVMFDIKYETIQVPYEEDVIVGYEPDLPPNTTLEVCPWLAYDPVFNGEKWIKTKEPVIEEPVAEPSELEKLKKQMELMQKAIDEMIIASIQ